MAEARSATGPGLEELRRRIRELVDRYRDRCFWSAPPDYYPQDKVQLARALEALQRYGDLEAFRLAGELRSWF